MPLLPLLKINNLSVEFNTRKGIVSAVNNVSFEVEKGKVLAVVGESGSGKSVSMACVLGILDKNANITSGSINYNGVALKDASIAVLSEIRGREISMIFQNPTATLNPIRKVGEQLADMLIEHVKATRGGARKKALKLLQQVKIKRPEQIMDSYPFQLSGGMCQRVMIALALACDPKILIADEPTTGLDVTTQKAIMDLIADLIKNRNMSVVLITHDLAIAAQYADYVVVMERGNVVESTTIKNLFRSPKADYSRKLIDATPRESSHLNDLVKSDFTLEPIAVDYQSSPLLKVESLSKHYQVNNRHQAHVALDELSFSLFSGECLGLVGESGCGKSTTSRIISRLEEASSGKVYFRNDDITAVPVDKFTRHSHRGDIQMVFQDHTESLNPRMTVKALIAEPMHRLQDKLSKINIENRLMQLCEQVRLPDTLLTRYPHQLSGGQKARVGIARALSVNPKLVILDEPTSALDVSVQAVILQLLHELRQKLKLSYLFISHDLNVVRLLCDRILVMRDGRIVEQGYTREVMTKPSHEYTQLLINSIPQIHM